VQPLAVAGQHATLWLGRKDNDTLWAVYTVGVYEVNITTGATKAWKRYFNRGFYEPPDINSFINGIIPVREGIGDIFLMLTNGGLSWLEPGKITPITQ
jgi:hypothetical protein